MCLWLRKTLNRGRVGIPFDSVADAESAALPLQSDLFFVSHDSYLANCFSVLP